MYRKDDEMSKMVDFGYTVACPQCGRMTPIGTECESCGTEVSGTKRASPTSGLIEYWTLIEDDVPSPKPRWYLITLENEETGYRWTTRAMWLPEKLEFQIIGYYFPKPKVIAWGLLPEPCRK